MKKQSAVRWAVKQLRSSIPALLVLTVSNIGSALLSVAFALGSRGVIDSAVDGSREAFLEACVMQGGIILGILVCQFISRHLHEYLNANLDRNWKTDLMRVLLHGDFTKVSQYHSAELINRLNNDVRILDDGILSILPGLASMLTKAVAAFAVLLALEPWFSILVIAAGVIVVVVTGFLRKRLKSLNVQVSEENGKVSGFFQETLEKLLMVQAMDVSDEMERRAEGLMQNRYQIQRKRKNVSLFANTCVSVMYYGAGFVALVWCSFGLLQGSMSFGSLTAVIQLVNQLQSPFVNMSNVIPQYIAMSAAAERLMELATLEQEPESSVEDPAALYAAMTAIGAEGLSFAYDRDSVMANASFSLPKGAFAVVTGPSGIGKSTLLKLLLGVFKPQEGVLYLECGEKRIIVNGTTRRLFAYVPQGNLLLSGTLRENLTVVKPEASEEEIREAVFVSAMDEFLPQLPNGLDTFIGESGAGLSEGQAQRLAVARAVLGGAPILLLDECTSALDAQTEKTVLERIRALPERTCIAVTHRPAAMEVCDWDLELDGSQIRMIKCKK